MLENVFFLENKGLFGVGNYDIFWKIFFDDNEVLLEIERVLNLFENIDYLIIGLIGMYINFLF